MIVPSVSISKLWNYCNVLRDDGMSYGDYVEQLTEGHWGQVLKYKKAS